MEVKNMASKDIVGHSDIYVVELEDCLPLWSWWRHFEILTLVIVVLEVVVIMCSKSSCSRSNSSGAVVVETCECHIAGGIVCFLITCFHTLSIVFFHVTCKSLFSPVHPLCLSLPCCPEKSVSVLLDLLFQFITQPPFTMTHASCQSLWSV